MSAIGDETTAMIVTGDETIVTTTACEIATLIEIATTIDLVSATATIPDTNPHVHAPPRTTTSEIVKCATHHRPAAEAILHPRNLHTYQRQANQGKRRAMVKVKVRMKGMWMRMRMRMQWRQ